ncbi:AAA family ATPase [Zavarzinella formosa]|uniref:AAA family ATPase n=1 Tax=Zavarzinella formosa TaxID=360055 RepID=UPI0002E14CE7|nr:AAA family ATPase [Zavarzinella formosa]
MGKLTYPSEPDWAVPWADLDPFPWMQDLKGCPQNPDRHAEGDVWIHVHMVCEAMAALPAWRALPEHDRQTMFQAALLHDVAKPACTRREADGRWSSRGHSWRGAIRARHILWRLGVPFHDREAVCAIVRHHLVPFFLTDSENPERMAIEVSQTARCDWLAIMAESDARGRICPDPDQLLSQVRHFREKAEELGCLDRPYQFPSDHQRYLFFREPHRHNGATTPPEDFRTRVVVMSGLPGAGKDYWAEQHLPDWPVISLDVIRQEMGIPPQDAQGDVVNRAREIARDFLRAGRDFVWNAQNLSRQVRSDCLRLFHDYHAHVRLVYVEAPPDRLFQQNRSRRRKVPEKVIERMLDRWEVPDRTEAHVVEYVV